MCTLLQWFLMEIIKTESLLNNASGNAGSINSGQSGGDAKQNNIWDDMEEKS